MGDPAAWGPPPPPPPAWDAPPGADATYPYAPPPSDYPGADPNAYPGAFTQGYPPAFPGQFPGQEGGMYPPMGPDGFGGFAGFGYPGDGMAPGVPEPAPPEGDPEAEALAQALLEEEIAKVARSEGPGEYWGFVNTPRGRAIARKFYIAGEDGLQVTLTNYGARVVSVRMPDSNGDVEEVVVGLDSLSDYETVKEYRLGCVLGRMTCPIIGPPQEKGHTNFDEMAWEAHLKNASHVVFSLHSPAGEQDYPGDLLVTVEYSLEPGNHLMVRMSASCTLATPLSMSARLPFNLAGQRSGPAGLASHHLMINARKFLETDKDGMLTGELRHSKHHGLLFLAPILMGNAFQKGPADGFNHHLLLNGNPGDGLRFIARLSHRPSGRIVEIYSNTRCLHLDTLNKLTVPSVEGKEFAGEEEEEQELGVAPYGAEYGAGQYGVVQPPTLPPPPPPPAQQMTDHFPIEGRPRSVSFTDQGDVQEHFGEYDYTETWGEDLTATTNAGEDADADIGGLLIEDTPAVRFLHELYAQGAVILAPEDYPDTIFEKQKSFTLEPGHRYERVVRFNFVTVTPPKSKSGGVVAGVVAGVIAGAIAGASAGAGRAPGAGDGGRPSGAQRGAPAPKSLAFRGSLAAGDIARGV